ncbi:hypothetical protein CIPAW_16G023900 [Carya illinoinensis]|uniref:Uncharacterized protein n=1 Tax=Carya illinoinensis TaxID=32201 RepID=A0A8T1N3H6_CARIL|nr:hypothetical protein CIPAW_16G023900 [Carya illinoinensis]
MLEDGVTRLAIHSLIGSSEKGTDPLGPLNFKQSGPLMPVLCNPFHADLIDRQCAVGEVQLYNATEAWKKYICQVSASGTCTTPGRVNPTYYNQMAASVNDLFQSNHLKLLFGVESK